jgi:MFS family permease
MGPARGLPRVPRGCPGLVTQASRSAPSAIQETGALRDYRLLLGAFVVSAAGDWLYKLALPLLVLKLTGSALQTAVVYSLEYVPYLLFAPLGGVISDRYDRRMLMIRADVAATGIAGLLAALVWFHQYRVWLIYLVGFTLSMITPLYQATFLGILPGIVPKERLGWANSRLQSGQGMLDLAGPLIGASAVAALGVNWALSLDAVSFALSAIGVALIRYRSGRTVSPASSGMIKELKDAAWFVRTSPALLWGSIVGAGSAFGLTMVEGNMVTYLIHFRHLTVTAVGVVFAALGLGALAGALLAARIIARVASGPLIIGCVLTGGSATALLIVLRQVPTIAAAWAIVGASTSVFIVTFFTLRHHLTPEHMLGRVIVFTRLIGFSLLPAAPIIGGAVFSTANTFWPVIALSAAIQIGVAGAALLTPFRHARA